MSSTLKPSDRKLAQEYLRRAELKAKLDPTKSLFGPQLAAYLDPSPAKVYCCSRRAGKTWGLAFDALLTAIENPKCHIPYITLTLSMADRNFWPPFRELASWLGIKVKYNAHNGRITLPNGSIIFFVGAEDEAEIHKLRGGKYPKVFIDECQSFRPHLTSLIQDVVEPCLLDYDGSLILAGTPNTACLGMFHDLSTGQYEGADAGDWTVHHWTVLQNPHQKDPRAYLEKMKRRHGWSDLTPKFRCEYLGIWTRDADSMAFRLDREKMCPKSWLPEIDYDWRYVLGIDLGWRSPTAFLVLAYNATNRKVVVVESEETPGLIPSAIAARIVRYQQVYDFESIVIDPGGLGVSIVEEFKTVHALPVEAAAKKPGYKATAIELVNGDLASGVLQVLWHGNQKLIQDMMMLQWNDKKTDFEKNQSDHLADALLYAWMKCRHMFGDDELNPPTPGSAEFWDAYTTELWEKRARDLAQRSGGSFSEMLRDDFDPLRQTFD